MDLRHDLLSLLHSLGQSLCSEQSLFLKIHDKLGIEFAFFHLLNTDLVGLSSTHRSPMPILFSQIPMGVDGKDALMQPLGSIIQTCLRKELLVGRGVIMYSPLTGIQLPYKVLWMRHHDGDVSVCSQFVK